MDIQLKKWGNSLGLRIPHQLTKNFGWDENSTLEGCDLHMIPSRLWKILA